MKEDVERKYTYNLRKCGLKKSEKDERDLIFEKTHLVMSVKLPKEFDILDKCPPISEQGAQGSCLGHSAAAARTILEGNNKLDLSKAFLYVEARKLEGNETRDVGCTLKSVCKVLYHMGVPLESQFPYDENIYDKLPSKETIESAKKYKIKKYHKITTIEGIKECLYQYKQGVLFGMHVYSNFYSDKTAKKGVVSMPSKKDVFEGFHSALICGFKDATILDKIIHFINHKHTNKGFFLCRNSYGQNWGLPEVKGYFLLPYEYVETEVFELWSFEK